MCGRFTLTQPEAIAPAFAVMVEPLPPPRYNIAPAQPIGVVVAGEHGRSRQFRLMQWGLIPAWAKDPKPGQRLINARAETAADKPSFRAAFARRRCLIPADGFYEWQAAQTGAKQPFYFRQPQHAIFALAGLWETWHDLATCTILTTEANAVLAPVHHRMPVILALSQYEDWLAPNPLSLQQRESMLQPTPDADLIGYPVSTQVNRPGQDSPACTLPLQDD